MKEFKDYSDEEQKYIQKKIDEITEETDPEKLSNNMDDLILEVSSVSSIGEGDTTINLEGLENKIELLSVILDGLDQLSDKEMFYNKIINSNELDEEITKYFEDNKEKFFEVKETEKEENVETPEKTEDPETVTEETKEEEKTVENNSEGTPETINEDKPENTKDPDEKINKYIEVTEQMEQELEKLISDLSSKKDVEYNQKMEIYSKRIKECEESLKFNNEQKYYKEKTIKTLNEQLEISDIKINPWEFSKIYKNEMDSLEIIQQELSGKSFSEMSLNMYGLKEKINNQITLMKENYGKTNGKLNNQEFIELIEDIKVVRQYKHQYENSISKTDEEINKEIEEIINNISYTDKNTILNIISTSEKIKNIKLELEKLTKEIEKKTEEKERYNKLQKEYEEFTNNIEIKNSDLKEFIEKTKHDIEERKNNINKYKEIDEEIKGLEGKELTDEEKNKKEEEIKNKINTITDDGLKEELTEKLNKALGKEKDPEKKEPTPIPPGPVKKDPKKWHRYMGGLGIALGATAALLIPGGFLGALAISAGVELANAGYTAYKVHQKRKQEKELAPENEITNINKIEKVKLAYERLKKDIKELNENDKWFKNITWLLHGAAIGSLAVGIGELRHGGDFIKFGGAEPIPEPVPQHEIPNIKVGDSATGLDMSTGYDTSNWAINGTNAESLNQRIMNDGNTVIRRIMDAEGKTYMSTEEAYKAGKTLQELSLDLASNTNLDRAFVNAGRAIGR